MRKTELKQRQKIQQKQKHQHRLQKLQLQDPIRLYFQIQKLENGQLDKEQQTRLKQLKDDWKFIEKNKLHQEKLQPFLEEQKRKEELKKKAETKLWGKQSIYFNPELNPLGKVPDVLKLLYEIEGTLANLTNPMKSKTKYQPDPLIESLGVVLPEGPRPQFYKKVQNITITRKVESQPAAETSTKSQSKPTKLKRTNLDSDSDAEINSDEEFGTWGAKRAKTEN